MVSGNGAKLLSEVSYQQLGLMVVALETGNLQEFAAVKYFITHLGRNGFDLREYPRRVREFEERLIIRSGQGDVTAAGILLGMANQLEQRMDGVYSKDIGRYREAASRS